MKFECSSCVKEPLGKINVSRFINKLDDCFRRNDMLEAVSTVEYWEKEARSLNDGCGLLSVLNEELGLFRSLNDEEKAMRAVSLATEILSDGEIDLSRGTVFINLATTLRAFGRAEESLRYYAEAEKVFIKYGRENTYEYAALLNNKSTALTFLRRFDEGESCLLKAIGILKIEGSHDVEIGVSYVSLAHLYFDRDENSFAEVEKFLDLSWEYINSERQDKNASYASAIKKCAPSFRYFQRELEADALEETAKEIYARG